MLVPTLSRRRCCRRSRPIRNANHFTEGMAVGTDDKQLTGPLLQWIEERR